MPSVNLTGVLVNPQGDPDAGAIVKFTLQTTTGETIKYSRSELIVPPNGAYDIDIVYGILRVDYVSDFTKRFVSTVIVNGDTTATTLPELLNESVPETNVQLRVGDGTTIWTSGAGTPESVLTAVVGSMYTRTDGGTGTTLYIKESGVSNTGWIAK